LFELEKMDQLAQRAVVRTVGIHRIEAAKAQPAKRAASAFIERERIHEGRAARGAEIFGGQRLGIAQAFLTNRNARDLAQSFAADTAIIGKNLGEKKANKAAKSRLRIVADSSRRKEPAARAREQAT